jgi:hypothetical protein
MNNKPIGFETVLATARVSADLVPFSPRRRPVSTLLAAMCLATPAAANQVPVSTISELVSACQAAQPGDSILIAPGTYTVSGASRILIRNRPGPVLVRGTTGVPADVVVRGAGQDQSSVQMIFNLDDSPYWTFEDMTTSLTYYHGFKLDHGSTDCVLRNVVMRDHGESGVKGTSDPASGRYPDRLLVESCDIGFTSPTGGTRSVVEGVDGVGVNDWVIRNNRFVNIQRGGNPAYGAFTKGNASNSIIEANIFDNCFIAASFGGGGTGAGYFRDLNTTYETRGGIIRNNVILRTTDAAVYVNKGHDCKIYNNTVFECRFPIQLRFTQSTGWVRNNLSKPPPSNPSQPVLQLRDGGTALADEANAIADDADFVTPSGPSPSLDLHLRDGSPKIDAGVAVGDDAPTDVDGNPRPSGNAFDIGADEFVSAAVAVHDGEAPRAGVLAVFPSLVRRGGSVRILLSGTASGTCAVYDAAGRRVMTLDVPTGALQLEAPAGHLPAGMYWLRLGSGSPGPAARVIELP